MACAPCDRRPHLVLDGLVCAAEAVGADLAVIWLHDRAHAVRRSVVAALAERRASGAVEPAMRIAIGPDRYLTGESSAIVRALSGGPNLPELRRVPRIWPRTCDIAGAAILTVLNSSASSRAG